MKRDLDLIKYICSNIEESSSFYVTNVDPKGEYSIEQIHNHLILLYEVGYIEGKITKSESGKIFSYRVRLTNEGYEFIELAKNNTVWNKFKEQLKSRSIDLSFTVVKEILISITRSVLL